MWWYGRGNSGGSWPPAFPRSIVPAFPKCGLPFFAVNIVGDTGLPTKDKTMKTTLNSKNTTIRSLTFAFCIQFSIIVAEFERRFKFKPRLKYGWFHLKLYQMFQDLSRRLI